MFDIHSALLYAVLKQDLDAYATMYAGMAKLLRLMHIASRCRALRVDALRLALGHVQTTHNVSMYRSIHSQLVEAINKSVFFTVSSCRHSLLIASDQSESFCLLSSTSV